MSNPIRQFSHLIAGLRELRPAYLHLVEGRIAGNADVEKNDKLDFATAIWKSVSPVFLAGGFTPTSAFEAVDKVCENKDVAIVFGRFFTSNPDLPYKLLVGIDLNPYDRSSFYTPEVAAGYTSYDFSPEFRRAFLHED